ncbi:hemagglutinin repeat-containing protein [Sodalis ligni]|uniref:hemagglutinin repeat-containing protein n=1 Tax=Sodalis ligni TaxID=2697027 RepID=UPI001BDEB0DE|nr:hemagglutinin repeat-containing protein [Sodalis ligni]QWA11596.1 hemagglutinin repeat-containing protein [Sodalis ligni]
MNKNLYRIIFNQARGMLMVVADIACAGHVCSGRGQPGRILPKAGRPCRLATLNFCLLMAFGGISFSARAGFAVDPHAPGDQQPNITQTANGIPQIDIQTPNEHGLSHNSFSQFDVDPSGVILNNSREHTQTQLGALVDGNSSLARGEASVILNEVNSPHGSHLNGAIEVAGRRADVIIANPSGITCDGCGFINAHNATLAAAQALVQDGRLKGFDVERGEIVFEGRNVNLNTNHALLIARAVRVNVEVQAGELTLTTGRNVTDSRGNVTHKKADNESPSRYALDVAALGGMYARKIQLVGNEHGLGVRNAGHIGAGVGEITLTIAGRLENSGSISSASDLHITVVDDVHNPGRMSSQGDVVLQVAGELNSSGTIAARGAISANSASLRSGKGSVWEAGRDEQGNATPAGHLLLTASGAITLGGDNRTSGTLTAAGSTLDLSGSQTTAPRINLSASQGETRLTGAVVHAPGGSLTINSPQGINSENGNLVAQEITLTTATLSNKKGVIHQTGSQDLILAIQSPSDSSAPQPSGSGVRNGGIQNNQVIDGDSPQDVVSPDIAVTLNNAGGMIQTAGNVTVVTGRLANTDGMIQAAGNASVMAKTIDNQKGKLLSEGNASVAVSTLANQGGVIQAPDRVKINAGTLDNSAEGRIVTKGDGEIKARSLDNTQGLIDVSGNLKIHAGTLDNHAGKIHTLGAAVVDATERLDNTHGELHAAGVTLGIGTLYNYAGEIHSSGFAVINSAIELDNSKGEIRADGDLTLKTNALDNSGGKLFSLGDTHLINANPTLVGAFINAGGSIQGNRHLDIDTGAMGFDNRQGTLTSLNTLQVKASALDNRNGRIYVVDKATLLIGERLDNDAGTIQGGNQLAIRADEVINTNTRRDQLGIQAPRMHINARRLDNAKGSLKGGEQLEVTLTETLDNRQGQLSAKKIKLGDDVLGHRLEADNDGGEMIAEEQGFYLLRRLTGGGRISSIGDLVIGLQNDFHLTGEINAGGNLTLNTAGSIRNDHLLTAGGISFLDAATLMNNTSAHLKAGDLQLTLPGTLSNHGQIEIGTGELSAQSLNNAAGATLKADELRLTLQSGLDNGGVINAGTTRLNAAFLNNATAAQIHAKALLLTLRDGLENSGLINTAKGQLNAQSLVNASAAEITAADLHLTLRDGLDNVGLIDADTLRLEAKALSNVGSGRIFGDHVALRTDRLENHAQEGQAGVIAARERLDIGAGHIDNRDKALILSNGNMSIGGGLDADGKATGRAGSLVNHDAEINADGDMTIAAREITNSNGGMVLTRVSSKENRHEAVLKGKTTRYDWNNVRRKKEAYGVHEAYMPDGSHNNNFYEYRYTRHITEDAVQESNPAKILAGGLLTVDAESFINRDSQVSAGGVIDAKIGDLRNESAQGERITQDLGRQTRWYAKKHKKKMGGTKTSQGRDGSRYRPIPIRETIDLKTAAWKENTRSDSGSPETRPALSGLFGRIRHNDEESFTEHWNHSPFKAPIPPEGPEQLFFRPLDLAVGEFYENPLPPVLTAGNTWTPAVRVMVPEVRLPASSLFSQHPGPANPYLVETNPRYTQYKQWIGLDYMQQKMKFDHNYTHKRLGDGFYEQRLVRDQVLNLTGQRYLDGHTNDNEQFKALMNAGVQYGKAFNLTPGVMLSPSQMALLTTDMVWLINQDVTLKDGSTQRVLVPQVYARVGKGDLSGDGALFSGQDIKLEVAGNLDNSGGITARETLKVSAENVSLSGQMAAKDIDVQARKDINQTGGRLFGGDRLSLLAGQDIRIQSTARGEQDNRWLDRTAGIYVQNPGGALELKALNNITLTAADIANQGESGRTEITAGNDLKLYTLRTANTDKAYWDQDNYRLESQRTDAGTRITSGGGLALSAGRDVSASAANIDAAQRLDLDAGRDITLSAGRAATSVVEHMKQSSSGMLSSMSLETHDEVHSRQALGTLLSGDEISLNAGRDLTVTGGGIAGTQDIALTAGNNLTLTTALETHHENHFRQEQSSGLMGSGGIGFTVGSESLTLTDDTLLHQQKGTLAGSAEGSATLSAGGRLTVHGSELIAGNGMALSGADVDLTAAENSIIQHQTMEQKKSGFTLALSGTVGSAINSAVESAQQAEKTDNSRLAALQRAKAALSGAQAVQAGRIAAAQGDSPENNNTIGVSLSYGSQSARSEQRHEQRMAQGSSLSAGGAMTVTATGRGGGGDIILQGGQLKAGSDISFKAKQDIHLLSALSREKTEGSNSSQGGSVGVGIGVGQGGFGISVFAGINKGKGSEKGNGTFHTNALLDAGRQVRLESGRDAILSGAQVKGETVKADIGRHLLLQSRQDSNDYDAKQQNVSAGGSFTFGSMTGSASVNVSRDKLRSNYSAVQEQTGLFAGQGGADIRVGEHTQLDGAVIASAADASKNRLDTGTLGFSDIHNEAEFSAEHQSIGLSSGGPIGGQFTGNLANGLLSGVNRSGHSSNTTRAAFSPGSLLIRNQAEQRQDIAALSRDAEHAHETLSPIFDKTKEQERLQQAALLGDIGNQLIDIVRSEAAIGALNVANKRAENISEADRQDARDALAKGKNPNETPTDKQIKDYIRGNAYNQALSESGFGTGGGNLKALTAVVAAAQGLAGGNPGQALAGLAAPYVATEIKERFDTDTARITAHAVAGAMLSHLQGHSALAGGAGALSAEVAAKGITHYLYPGIEPGQLTEKQKETVSAWSSMVGGLAGGLTGKGGGDVVAGAQAGKNAVENNSLGGAAAGSGLGLWLGEIPDCDTECKAQLAGDIAQGNAKVSAHLAGTIGLAMLPGGAQVAAGIGSGANAAIQYAVDGEVSYTDALIAGWVGGLTATSGFGVTVGVNAVGGAASNAIKGDDPLTGAITSGLGAVGGYGIGKGAILGSNAIGKYATKGWNPKFDPNHLKYREVKGLMGISKEMSPSKIPGVAGNVGSSAATEIGTKILEKRVEKLKTQNDE